MISIFVVGLAQVKLFVKHEQTQKMNATELSFIIQFLQSVITEKDCK